MTTEAERISRLEGIVDSLGQRVSDMDTTHTSEFTALRQDIGDVRTELHRDIENVRRSLEAKIYGLFGVIVTMWVTVILAIIFAP